MSMKAHHGAIYFINLINYYSRYVYVYLLSYKYEALDVFKCLSIKVVNISLICSKVM